eukprot:365458-Chlamydomonas_euryale.AAC.9
MPVAKHLARSITCVPAQPPDRCHARVKQAVAERGGQGIHPSPVWHAWCQPPRGMCAVDANARPMHSHMSN